MKEPMMSKMLQRSILTACAITAAMAISGAAKAVPLMNATVGGAFINTDYAGDGTSGVDLGNTTTLTMDSTGFFTSRPSTYTPAGGSSAPNTFLSLNTVSNGQTFTSDTSISLIGITTSPTADNLPGFITFIGSTGTYALNVTYLYIESEAPDGSSITLGAFGNLTDGSGNYATTPALALLNFEQSGNSGAVSGTFTLGSPPSLVVPPVPEPASMLILASGLLGLNVFRRRRE